MDTILVTGFDPFGGDSRNPAGEALALLPAEVAGTRIATVMLPTAIGSSFDRLLEALELHRPVAVLSVGQAGGRPGITVERVAINLVDARIPDNEGRQPVDLPAVPGGPAAYFSTLPVKAMAARIRAAGIPATVSNSAGTFVCNYIMYRALHHAATAGAGFVSGFIHVPPMPAQAAGSADPTPTMSLESVRAALVAALEAIALGEDGGESGRSWGALS